MDLFILRHGEAGKSSVSAGDYKRALTIQGKKQIEELSKALISLDVKFDKIFTSPLVRAKQTAETVETIIKHIGNVEELECLKPEGNKLELNSTLSKLKRDSKVLIVGHEPYLSELIGEAISNSNCRIILKKGGLARIRIQSIIPLKGELRWLLAPKHSRKMMN